LLTINYNVDNNLRGGLFLRTKIFELLRQHSNQYVSGEMISKQLAVSRTAIWKHIQAIKQEGYLIESHPRKGYCLRQAPDLLLPGEVDFHLDTEWLGRNISYFSSIGSTNDEAKKLAGEGKPAGTIVLAEEQTAGRGRLARKWVSPPGTGIWFSVILRPRFLPQEAPKFTLMAAVAVNRAILNCTGVSSGIKWPNDIVYKNKKIAGILTEMNAEMDGINYIVLGIGINVNVQSSDLPEEIHSIATSLSMVKGSFLSRVNLLAEVLLQLERLYEEVCCDGFGRIFEEWRRMTVTLGQMVDVTMPERKFCGLAVDIDDAGALLVETDHGKESILAGDVKIRPSEGGRVF